MAEEAAETKKQSPVLFEKRAVQWIVLFGVFFGTIAAILVFNYNFDRDINSYLDIPQMKPKEIAGALRVTIDFGNGRKRAFEGSPGEPLTVVDALRAIQQTAGISLKVALSGTISELDKIRPAAGKQWNWYLNGVRQEKPVSDAVVMGGDKVLLKYE